MARQDPDSSLSLSEVNASIMVPAKGPAWRRWLAVAGPALMVSVGYMDPGNWATDIAGGSRYEYRLLWVLLISNLMAVLLQSLAARLGIVRRRDLAQVSRETYPRYVNLPLYALAEVSIAGCDLAEVLGSAIALNLLFRLPLIAGVILTSLDALLLLVLTRFGIRKLEAVILSLVGVIGLGLVLEIFLARPEWGRLAWGFVPNLQDSGALYLAIGILGATIMPHNLYLHSALVQTRRFGRGTHETRRAIRLNTFDSALTLNVAFFINAALLIVAAAVFFRAGHRDVQEIQDAHRLLEPIVGTAIAPVAFAIALLASGQGSTVTGTLAGQIVMEGYLDFRIRPWLRRLITRVAAIIPALICLAYAGEHSVGRLLVLSQVILSLQLPFAAIPLIHFVSDRRKMSSHVIGPWLRVAAWCSAAVIVGLNIGLVIGTVREWLSTAGPSGWWIRLIVFPPAIGLGGLLLWVTFHPWLDALRGRWPARVTAEIHREVALPTPLPEAPAPVRRVAIALDFSGREEKLLSEALRFLAPNHPTLILIHVVESPSSRAFGQNASDLETLDDAARIESFAKSLQAGQYEVLTALGHGDPVRELARLVEAFGAELVILGGHGHRGLADVIHGTTAEALRHRVKASVLVIPLAES